MTCADVETRFRLLDANVGWDPLSACGLSGLDDTIGLRLFDENEPRISSDDLSAYIPPAWLAPGCRPCEWYLVAGDNAASVMRKDPCTGCWIDILPTLAGGEWIRNPTAVTTAGSRLAVSGKDETGRPVVFVWSIPDRRLTALLAADALLAVDEDPRVFGPLVFAPWGELIVAHQTEAKLLRYTPTGDFLGETPFSASESVRRLAVGIDGAVWAATGPEFNRKENDTQNVKRKENDTQNEDKPTPEFGPFELWRFEFGECDDEKSAARRRPLACCELTKLTVTQLDNLHLPENKSRLARNFIETGLAAVSREGFCIQEPAADGSQVTHCFHRDGTLARDREIFPAPKPNGTRRFGQLLTQALDSGIPRCQWHRVRVDADFPARTRMSIALATSEDGGLNDGQHAGEGCREEPNDFSGFPNGVPHPLDWEEVDNLTDFLIRQPRGRYLHVRIRLMSENESTPVIRRVRLDFPRVTSLQQLPAVYRELPAAEDFTQRFLSLYDASIDDMDAVVDRFAALLDPDGVPEKVLPWIATFLGIVFDPRWDSKRRRRLLLAAPALYRQRGTVAGLIKAVELIFGVTPVIDERALRRAWGVLNKDAHLNSMRLFGRSQARFRIGRSALGLAPLRSFGNPDHDPFRGEAHRFTVLMPPSKELQRNGLEHLDQLIANQKPAHTAHSLRVGGDAFVVGRWSVIGIDTQLRAPPPPVLGSRSQRLPGSARLSEMSILQCGVHGRLPGMRVGSTHVGVNTLVE